LLSLGFVLLMSVSAWADDALEDDCLVADPRFSPEACAAVFKDGNERSADQNFRLEAAEANAELLRGEIDYALLDFEKALDEVDVHGASPPDQVYADVTALYAIAHLRNSDPASALQQLYLVQAEDPRNARLPLLYAYTAFAAGDAAGATKQLDVLIAARPNDQSMVALNQILQHWQKDPATAVAECKAQFNNAECGAKALSLSENDKAAADLVSSILGGILGGGVTRMSREEAPGAWSDCDAPEPQYAGSGCDMILAGNITPEERYEAEVKRIIAFLHNDDAGGGIIEAEHLVARVGYGVARPADDGPSPAAARALLAQAHLQRGEIDEASAVLDDALADQPDDPTFLALHGIADLAAGRTDDADANMALAADDVPSEGPTDVATLAGVVAAANSSIEEGVASCQEAFPDAPCGADEAAAGDTPGALAAIASSINAAYLGDAEHPYTLIGVDALP
jgi:Flp pilus assembly protein TadD